MNEQDLRDCFAMFAMINKRFERGYEEIEAKQCWAIADAMLATRAPKEEVGITAVKRVRKTK
jgi:hypothetical protein